MIDEQEALSRNIKAFRKEHHLTQTEMAEECGISKETLSLIERQRHNPTLETMQDIAARMGISVSFLLRVRIEEGPHYRLVEQSGYRTSINSYSAVKTYGVEVVSDGVVVKTVLDIFTDINRAKKFVSVCNKNKLSLTHLFDVIDDWLNE